MKLPVTPSFRLDGRRAIVTGASSGLGMAAAVALAEAGAEVVLVARRMEELHKVVDAIRYAGGQAQPKALDVTDLKAVSGFLQSVEPFEILVSAAGLARHAPSIDTSEDA